MLRITEFALRLRINPQCLSESELNNFSQCVIRVEMASRSFKIINSCTNRVLNVSFFYSHSILYQSSVIILWANFQKLPNPATPPPPGKFSHQIPEAGLNWALHSNKFYIFSLFSRPQSLIYALNIYKFVGRT